MFSKFIDITARNETEMWVFETKEKRFEKKTKMEIFLKRK
jgi:hypothetical protein